MSASYIPLGFLLGKAWESVLNMEGLVGSEGSASYDYKFRDASADHT